MSAFISWLAAAPQGALGLVATILAALVAALTAVLTQWILGRRARTDLLTHKLEELYLALDQAGNQHVNRCVTIRQRIGKPPIAGGVHLAMGVDTYATDLQKKIIMYVRLYFPQLQPASAILLAMNRRFGDLVHQIAKGQLVSPECFDEAGFQFGDALRYIESELIENRALLVNDHLLPRRFRRGNPKALSRIPMQVRRG